AGRPGQAGAGRRAAGPGAGLAAAGPDRAHSPAGTGADGHGAPGVAANRSLYPPGQGTDRPAGLHPAYASRAVRAGGAGAAQPGPVGNGACSLPRHGQGGPRRRHGRQRTAASHLAPHPARRAPRRTSGNTRRAAGRRACRCPGRCFPARRPGHHPVRPMSFQLSSWAIRRPVPTLVLFLILTLCGWHAFRMLPIQASPQVSFPLVSITVTQAGAAPSELELDVARPVEDALAALPGLRRITSTLSDGLYLGMAEFQLDVAPDRAVSDVRDAIAKVRAELPGSIQEPQVARVDVENEALSYYAVGGEGQSPADLSWFVDDTVRRALLAVPGVEQVERLG